MQKTAVEYLNRKRKEVVVRKRHNDFLLFLS